MRRMILRSAVILLVLAVLLPASQRPVLAARVLSFNNNAAVIFEDEVCRTGATVAAWYTPSWRNPNARDGEGSVVIFQAFTTGGTPLANEQSVTMVFNANQYYDYYVYGTGRLTWNSQLSAGTEIIIQATLTRNNEKVADRFIIADCPSNSLNQGGFTYQGRLQNGGTAANGPHDFRFTLFDAKEGGAATSSLEQKAVNVTDGLFTTQLNFPSSAFKGGSRWLEIEVAPSGGNYTKLTPRQPILPAPLALYALDIPQHSHMGETWTLGGRLRITGKFFDNSGGEEWRNFPVVIQNTHDNGQGLYVSALGNAAIQAENVGTGNAVTAYNNNQYAAIYGENASYGYGIAGYSETGPAASFTTATGANIILAQQALGNNNFAMRFRVAANGDVVANGRYLTGSADFAEMLPAATPLEPGDVLVIGADGQLARSTTPNASNVAGVYSTQPGFVGGYTSVDLGTVAAAGDRSAAAPAQVAAAGAVTQTARSTTLAAQEAAANAGKVPLAVVGVVPVKVSAENGPILPGDLLTSASLAGHAMKAQPVDVAGVRIHRPGTIIGKALEPLPTETGVIRVLVTLQ